MLLRKSPSLGQELMILTQPAYLSVTLDQNATQIRRGVALCINEPDRDVVKLAVT
jgi:hypothetical protein